MTPSISKTLVLEESAEELLLRKRILSSETKPQQKDHNNNNQSVEREEDTESYKIDDINYLRAETEKRSSSTSQRDATTELGSVDTTKPDYSNWKPEIRWPDTIVQLFLHGGFVYGLYLIFYAKFYSILWFFALIVGSGFGITAGAHRLWSHNSYTANLPMRILLVFLFTIAGQRDAYTWAHDHRVHHKFSESDADPHNAKRGFFFAHVGWLILTPHPEVVEKRKIIDMRDLEADPVVMFQKKYFEILFAIITIGMPVAVPWYFWNESLWISFWVMFNCRFCITLNIAFFVNSVAHMWGAKPYDKKLSSVESLPVAIAAFGEGWHNYHHVFPWDYKTGELGDYRYNVSTAFIDFFAKIGWATNRKSVSPDMIARRAAKCGDGSHFLSEAFAHKDAVWGYGDTDIPCEDQQELRRMKN